MAAPEKPQLDYSYVSFQQELGDNSFPGSQLQNDLDELVRAADDTIDALADVRRSDGALPNGKVTPDSLSAATRALMIGTGPTGPTGPAGVVQSVVAGANVAVDASDPANPVVSSSGGVASDVDFTPAAGVGATNVQGAIEELSGDVTAQALATTVALALKLDVTAAREKLQANRTYYVRTDGSDSNNGLANTAGGAFLTIQKAITVSVALDLAGFAVVIQVGSGTYTGNIAATVPFVGGSVTLRGDTATPANCILQFSSFGAFTVSNYASLSLEGFDIRNNAGSSLGNGIVVSNGGVLTLSGNKTFGACTRAHMEIGSGGKVAVNAGYTINGNSNYHWLMNGGEITLSGPTITLSGTPAFGVAFLDASNRSGCTLFNITFTGSATGKRYNGSTNAVINSFGAGATYLPGNAAGTIATGAAYT